MKTIKLFITQWGLTIVSVAGVMWLLGSSPGWYHTLRLRAHVRTTQHAIAQLTRERDQLIATIRRHDSHVLGGAARARFATEQIAREQLQLGKRGEIVYR